MTSNGFGDKSRIQMQLIVGDQSGEWQIHAIRWYPDHALVPQKR
jgi:hypothetical protein